MGSATDGQDIGDRRGALMEAAESDDGFESLRDLVQQLLEEGVSKDSLLEDLSQIRPLVDARVEDSVLDVMDLLVGWCGPEFRLGE